MNLSILDRIIILNSILPPTGTIEQIKTIRSIKSKLNISETDKSKFNVRFDYANMISVDINDQSILIKDQSFDLTNDELTLIKLFAEATDRNGWITESSLDTIEMLINYTVE